jgi:hypothetical protein
VEQIVAEMSQEADFVTHNSYYYGLRTQRSDETLREDQRS